MAPEEEEQEEEEFEPTEEEEFEPVEERKGPEVVEEFESFDENAPDDITSSGFKTKGGEIPDYEPTVDEVLSYAMGKTKDPSQPSSPPATMALEMDDGDDHPGDIGEAMDELIEEVVPAEGPVGDEEGEEIEGLDEAFSDEEERE